MSSQGKSGIDEIQAGLKGQLFYEHLAFLNEQDERVRIAAAQLRCLHQGPACFQRIMKKASLEEKKNVESTLWFLMKSDWVPPLQ